MIHTFVRLVAISTSTLNVLVELQKNVPSSTEAVPMDKAGMQLFSIDDDFFFLLMPKFIVNFLNCDRNVEIFCVLVEF